MSKLETLHELINKCEATFETNYPVYDEYKEWSHWYVDVDPGFGDWDEPLAEPHLDQAIEWLQDFVERHNLS